MTAGPKCKSCYSEKIKKKKRKKKKNLQFFLYSQKTDKDEFNTILKHLIKLVKNFKPTVIFFLTFHIYLFFFFNSPVQVVSGLMGVWVGFQVGAVLYDRNEEELRGEVSICDLYSPVTSWGHAKRATLHLLRSWNAFQSVLSSFGEQ